MPNKKDWEEDWERVLWKRKPYPDNYVPPVRFLEFLKRNTNVVYYTYWPLVGAALAIDQHISTIFLFLAVFIRLREQSIDPRHLLLGSVAAYFVGYLCWEALSPPQPPGSRSKTVKSSILVFLALIGVSPVLRTLTQATASDSIWALSASLFMLHTILADYTAPSSFETKERLTSVLSMNAAISASSVLASRLESDMAVLSMTLLAVHSFALFPLLRRRLQLASFITRALLTLMLSLSSIFFIDRHSRVASTILGGSLFFITFLSPALLVWAQRYKNEIRGPWDLAVPQVT